MRKFKNILLAFMMIAFVSMAGILAPKVHAAHTISDWDYNADGYAYYTGPMYDYHKLIETADGADLYYKLGAAGAWTKVPNFNELVQGGTAQYDRINVIITSSSAQGATYALTRPKYPPGEQVTVATYSGEDRPQFRFNHGMDLANPVFSGQTAYISNVDAPVSEATIRSGLTAFDNVDGNITNQIQLVSDGYTANKTTLGTYQIKYKVTDAAGNTANLTVSVTVVDVTGPKVYEDGVEKYNFRVEVVECAESGAPYTMLNKSYEQLVNDYAGDFRYEFQFNYAIQTTKTISFNDNVDGYWFEVIDVSNDLEGLSKIGPGEYDYVFKVRDKSGNLSQPVTFTFVVVDRVAPVISGQNAYSTLPTNKLSTTTIKSGLVATDNVDGNISTNITLKTDNYSLNWNKIGVYTIVYQVDDSSGNHTEFTVTVTVTDDVPPNFYVNDAFITLDEAASWTQEQIIAHLVEIGQLPAGVQASYSITTSNYMSAPGEYVIILTRNADAPEDPLAPETYTVGVLVNEAQTPPEPVDPGTEQEPPADNPDGNDIVIDTESFEAQFKEFWNKNKVYIVAGILGLIVVVVILRVAGFGRSRYRRKY